MKKVLLYILCMVFLCFLIPILFTQKNRTIKQNEVNLEEIENNNETYDYGNLNKVKLLHTDTRRNRRIRIR